MKPLPLQPNDRERFLAAVAEQVPIDRVVELYLFQPMRQGGVESGVAVIAAAGDTPVALPGASNADGPQQGPPDVNGSQPDAGDSPVPQPASAAPHEAQADGFEPRYTVFTAHYRHVLKGPE